MISGSSTASWRHPLQELNTIRQATLAQTALSRAFV